MDTVFALIPSLIALKLKDDFLVAAMLLAFSLNLTKLSIRGLRAFVSVHGVAPSWPLLSKDSHII